MNMAYLSKYKYLYNVTYRDGHGHNIANLLRTIYRVAMLRAKRSKRSKMAKILCKMGYYDSWLL